MIRNELISIDITAWLIYWSGFIENSHQLQPCTKVIKNWFDPLYLKELGIFVIGMPTGQRPQNLIMT